MAESKKKAAEKDTAKSANGDRSGDAKAPDESVKDSGPGTGQPDPPAEEGRRSSEGTEVVDPESGPLAAPDVATQVEPAEGYDESSTDHTYAAAGGRTVAGETFDSLVDEDGNEVSAQDLFEGEDKNTFVTAKKRVFEQFYYPNTTEVCTRLLFVEGQRVNRAEAERIKATMG